MTKYNVLDVETGAVRGTVYGYSVDHAWVKADLTFAGRIAVIRA